MYRWVHVSNIYIKYTLDTCIHVNIYFMYTLCIHNIYFTTIKIYTVFQIGNILQVACLTLATPVLLKVKGPRDSSSVTWEPVGTAASQAAPCPADFRRVGWRGRRTGLCLRSLQGFLNRSESLRTACSGTGFPWSSGDHAPSAGLRVQPRARELGPTGPAPQTTKAPLCITL